MMSLEGKNTGTVVAFLWAGQIIWAGKAERGEVTVLLVTIQGEDFKTEHLSFHFLKSGEEPRAWFTPIKMSSHWGTKGRLGELILMLNNLLK